MPKLRKREQAAVEAVVRLRRGKRGGEDSPYAYVTIVGKRIPNLACPGPRCVYFL